MWLLPATGKAGRMEDVSLGNHYLRPCCGINEQKAEMAEWGEVAAAAAWGGRFCTKKKALGKFWDDPSTR